MPSKLPPPPEPIRNFGSKSGFEHQPPRLPERRKFAPVADIDDSYDEDLFEPEISNETPRAPEEAFTISERIRLRDMLAERARRSKEGLRLYRPYPNQELFHASKAKIRLPIGGNRGGKTLVAAVDIARGIMGVDPYDKYPHRPLRGIFVGRDLSHCGKVMYRKLFQHGAIQILRDADTGEWRSYDPNVDGEDTTRCEPAGPLIPSRMIKSISWEDKKEEIPKTIKLTTGHEMTAFTGEGEPPQGWDVDWIWMDEEIGHPKWISEMLPRLVDRGGLLIWSFTPQVGSAAAWELCRRAEDEEGDENPRVQQFFYNIRTNTFISEVKRNEFEKDMLALGDEEYRVRVLGEHASLGQRVYPEFAPRTVHRCDTFQIPENWTRYAIIDPGRTVAAALFLAVPHQQSEYSRFEAIVYKEIFCRKADAVKFAKEVKSTVGADWIHEWIIDRHGADRADIGVGKTVELQYREAFLAEGMTANNFKGFIWASDDIDGGILAVKNKLQVHDGQPKWLFMHENLRWLAWQVERYHNQKHLKTGFLTDNPIQRNCDLPDCLRYAALHNLRYVTPPRRHHKTESWTAKYLKAKRKRKISETPGSGGIVMF